MIHSTPPLPEEKTSSLPRTIGTTGGVADKLGNKYELEWAIRYALHCIQNEHRSLTLEDITPTLALGSEFTYTDEHGQVSAIQVKRQDNTRNHWSIASLKERGVLEAAAHHVTNRHTFHFCSTTPSGLLRDMTNRARQSNNLRDFISYQLTNELETEFKKLSDKNIFGSPEKAWQTLKGTWIHVMDEEELGKNNSELANALFEDINGEVACATIGRILLKKLRMPITQHQLVPALEDKGIKLRDIAPRITAKENVLKATESWLRSIKRELLDPPIERRESTKLVELMTRTRLTLVVAPGGGGKSSVLYQATLNLKSQGAEVLAFRLDHYTNFSSPLKLGQEIGLDTSPVTALKLSTHSEKSFLIIDQLDAISIASGRFPERYDIIQDIIQEAMSTEHINIVLSCRDFDVENDHRIRRLASRDDVSVLHIEKLSIEAMERAVSTMNLNPGLLNDSQRFLLRSPLNLVLLSTIADRPSALNFTTQGSLFDAFLERKREAVFHRRSDIKFNDTLTRIVNTASDNQSLSVSIEVLDADDLISHARVLASEDVITITNNRVSLFHETFFDYIFARQWLSRRQSIVDFLGAPEQQELFRRTQVRQILEMLRERAADRFRNEIESLASSPQIRFHIKVIAVAVLARIDDPTSEDAEFVLRLTEEDSLIAQRLWLELARPTWFNILNTQGYIENWLDSNDASLRERSIRLMSSADAHSSEKAASILSQREKSAEYAMWLNQVAARPDIHLCRSLFESVLKAVREGRINPNDRCFQTAAQSLATYQPLWGIELLSAYFIESPHARDLDEHGKIALLGTRHYRTIRLIQATSKAEPQAFAERFVPFLLTVMETTHYEGGEQYIRRDRHFSQPPRSIPGYEKFDQELYDGTLNALREWSRDSPTTLKLMLQNLVYNEHESAQALLYSTFIASPENYFTWAAKILLEGGNRLKIGHTSHSPWRAREVLKAIAPKVGDEIHLQLEAMFRDLPEICPSDEPRKRLNYFGYTAFEFLSALDAKRLTPHAVLRLQEYRRKFQVTPDESHDNVHQPLESPINGPATKKMSNTHWLRAIEKHNSDRRYSYPPVGGASQLAEHLQHRTSEDPARFAELATQLTANSHPAYATAILNGFKEASFHEDTTPPAISRAIHHIMSLGFESCDRLLGWVVSKIYSNAPLDIVELLRDRVLQAVDPVDNSPLFCLADEAQRPRDLLEEGLNTTRGSLVYSLGELLFRDLDGSRTNLVAPYLVEMAADHVMAVRACLAHTITACLHHARPAAHEAFLRLIDADDVLLASDSVERLLRHIGNSDPSVVDPVIDRMLSSTNDEVLKAGGRMAAFAAVRWGRTSLIERALSGTALIRQGAAMVCAALVNGEGIDSNLVFSALSQLMHDDDDQVRRQVAFFASNLRGVRIRPYADLLMELVASPSYVHATPQLFITLEDAPDKVTDIVERAAQRFLEIHGDDVADIRTEAAGDVDYISRLVVRGLTETCDKKRMSTLLDILDHLLELGVYGVEQVIDDSKRT